METHKTIENMIKNGTTEPGILLKTNELIDSIKNKWNILKPLEKKKTVAELIKLLMLINKTNATKYPKIFCSIFSFLLKNLNFIPVRSGTPLKSLSSVFFSQIQNHFATKNVGSIIFLLSKCELDVKKARKDAFVGEFLVRIYFFKVKGYALRKDMDELVSSFEILLQLFQVGNEEILIKGILIFVKSLFEIVDNEMLGSIIGLLDTAVLNLMKSSSSKYELNLQRSLLHELCRLTCRLAKQENFEVRVLCSIYFQLRFYFSIQKVNLVELDEKILRSFFYFDPLFYKKYRLSLEVDVVSAIMLWSMNSFQEFQIHKSFLEEVDTTALCQILIHKLSNSDLEEEELGLKILLFVCNLFEFSVEDLDIIIQRSVQLDSANNPIYYRIVASFQNNQPLNQKDLMCIEKEFLENKLSNLVPLKKEILLKYVTHPEFGKKYHNTIYKEIQKDLSLISRSKAIQLFYVKHREYFPDSHGALDLRSSGVQKLLEFYAKPECDNGVIKSIFKYFMSSFNRPTHLKAGYFDQFYRSKEGILCLETTVFLIESLYEILLIYYRTDNYRMCKGFLNKLIEIFEAVATENLFHFLSDAILINLPELISDFEIELPQILHSLLKKKTYHPKVKLADFDSVKHFKFDLSSARLLSAVLIQELMKLKKKLAAGGKEDWNHELTSFLSWLNKLPMGYTKTRFFQRFSSSLSLLVMESSFVFKQKIPLSKYIKKPDLLLEYFWKQKDLVSLRECLLLLGIEKKDPFLTLLGMQGTAKLMVDEFGECDKGFLYNLMSLRVSSSLKEKTVGLKLFRIKENKSFLIVASLEPKFIGCLRLNKDQINLLRDYKELIEEINESVSGCENKTSWWRKRYLLENKLKCAVHSIVENLMPFIELFLRFPTKEENQVHNIIRTGLQKLFYLSDGNFLDRTTWFIAGICKLYKISKPYKRKLLKETLLVYLSWVSNLDEFSTIQKQCIENWFKSTTSNEIVDTILEGFSAMELTEKENAQDLANHTVATLKDLLKKRNLSTSGRKIELIKRLETAISSTTERHKINLILDDEFKPIPLEASKPFEGRLTNRVMDYWCVICSRTGNLDNLSPGFGLVDPKASLPRTLETLRPIIRNLLEAKSWNFVSGKILLPEKVLNHLKEEDNQIYFYSGHGSGDKYLSEDCIEKHGSTLTELQLACLMGCRSVRVEKAVDRLSAVGYVRGLLEKQVSVLGCLWNVTDKDLDFISTLVLEYFHQGDPYTSLEHCIRSNSKKCRLPWLNASAVIIYNCC
eukprot:snap_masked-scaffold_2-processed-gene-14.31-mRNA-1 protein AED:1.00 eAED:1.00 QI:0/0/0/0/1/1/5/0/1262